MKRRTLAVATLLVAALLPLSAFSQCTLNTASPSVTICTPSNNASVSSPVHVVAGTTDSQFKVTVLQIYVDGVKAYQTFAATLDTSVTMSAGTHRLTVQAMDSANTIFKSSISVTVASAPPPPPPPPPGGTNSPIKHVVVVIMQNRGFDHLFGTMPGVNGITPSGPGYSQRDANGNVVTPYLLTTASTSDVNHSRKTYLAAWDNGAMDKYAYTNGDLSMGHYDNTMPGIDKLWTWAQTYALADNYFPSAMSNGPSQQLYLAAASDNNFPWSVQPYYGPCQKPDAAATPLTFRNVGDQMNTSNVSWAWFSENYGQCTNGYLPVQNPFQFFASTQNTSNIQDLTNFYTALTNGALPSVSYIQPDPSHSMHPGSGSVTTAANWLDGFIKRVQNSSSWADTAIVITWDESGGWWDHVPPPQIDSQGLGQRVPLIVISPYAKKGYVSHVQMDHVSILKWIQWNWALGTLNTREDKSNDVGDMFQF